MHRIEICLKNHLTDARGMGLVKDIFDLGIKTVSTIYVSDIYYLDATLTGEDLERVCRELLADPVSQEYFADAVSKDKTKPGFYIVEVTYNAGVVDPVEETVLKATIDMNINGIRAVKTAKRYLIAGKLNRKQLNDITCKLLVNPIVQHAVAPGWHPFATNPKYIFRLNQVEVLKAKKSALEAVRRQYGFTESEFKAICDYYKKEGQNPTDVELETLAQTWSEHCVHKTFKAKITYGKTIVNNILKSTIVRATKEMNKPWCLSVFVDNAGVIEFDDQHALCFKVETHNHPSALEPYGGAATGIGGVVRDVMGTGLGADPILNTDVFCFAPPDFPPEKLPKGVLHPRRVYKGVRAGVADYGNRLGIPTLNGAILFDNDYVANPLVFCGTLGVMPKDKTHMGKQKPGDKIVVIGGKTGRDGIHGVTFASEQLTEASSDRSFTSVQIGNAIVEKKVLDILLTARDRGLYNRIQDVGGGGLSSAVGEVGADTGVRVDLGKVPLKYAGLSYAEIWISESQERMIISVPPQHVATIMELFASEDVEAAVIGEFTNDKRLRLFYQGNQVSNLSMDFLHEGRPQWQLKAVWHPVRNPEPAFRSPSDLGKSLKAILSAWNICSKEDVIRQYDHEVQGGSVLKPLVGVNNDGPSDAAIVRPVLDSDKGVIVANGINPKYSKIDPYWMAASAIDESLRQIVAVGGSLDRVALLDNFCWGDTRRPERLGALIRAAQACYDMAIAYGTPFISGKDSLYNEFECDGKVITIPDTLLISAMGVMDEVNKAISMDFKIAGSSIYVVGATKNELGGSAYLEINGKTGNSVPKVEPGAAKLLMDKLSAAINKGLVRSCHDCSEGGIGVAVAEMAFAGGLGANIYLKAIPLAERITRDDYILFSESNSRFVVEVAAEKKIAFEMALKGFVFAEIGTVKKTPDFIIYGLKGEPVVKEMLVDLREAWQKPLR